MSSLYMKYIALDAIKKALNKVDAKASSVSIEFGDSVQSVERFMGTDTTYRLPGLDVVLENWYISSESSYASEDRVEALRAERERIIPELLEVLPGSFTDRDGNTISLYAVVHGITVSIKIGEALCERVIVGTKKVKRRDPELSARLLATLDEVEVEEPIIEWRCSDDILGSMAHKAAN